MQLGASQEKLEKAGVETLAIVITPADRGLVYFRYRPNRATLLADAEAATHRASGVPRFDVTADEVEGSGALWPAKISLKALGATRVNPTGELPAPLPVLEAIEELNRRDGIQLTEVDEQVRAATGSQLAGHFLIDRDGVVRWAHLEARERVGAVAAFPSEEDLLRAAAALPR